ncbi:hypothetical protein QBC46DRAFT_277942 [Diplogelasinospora grovesii]|uniref:J domain-containing protein n=1 Tax=Diplogelasinospora grovesii TaxID=303347 RepID=A0AAN6NGK6_9PEZI|nr:hypothetical protein QBC46DRAFT_277942 [Diplogelasinospora grovesii]
MADPSSRSIRAPRARASSRAGSVRSSAVFDNSGFLHPGAFRTPSHTLRPAESRFSLNEQFAATRRDFEFGFDDAASIWERSTVASQVGQDNDVEQDDTVLVGTDVNRKYLTHRDHYELLCLPKDASLSPDEIRRAFQRLLHLFRVDAQPPHLQSAAALYLGLVQAAFETLIEPYRRIGYDVSPEINDDVESCCDEDDDGVMDSCYETALQTQKLLQWSQREAQTVTDLGLRLDAASSARRNRHSIDILDLSVKQSTTVSVPALREPMEKAALFLQETINNRTSMSGRPRRPVRCADPTVTITGSAHGLLDEPFKLASLLSDCYQPPGPSIHGPRRLQQLLASRFLPVLNLNLRQELFWRDPGPEPRHGNQSRLSPGMAVLPDLVLENDVEILPHPSITVRVGHSIDIPDTQAPLNVEVSVQKLLHAQDGGLAPSLGLALHRRVASRGTAFLVLDSGDWGFWPTPKECMELSEFMKMSPARGGLAAQKKMMDPSPFRSAPTVEIGYTFGSREMGVRAGRARAFTKASGREGVSGMEEDNSSGSWTVSGGLTPGGTAAAYLRYGRELFSSLTPSHSSGFRTEVELSTTNSSRRDLFLALRALKRVGRFSKVGFEVGFTPNNLHLSLYWSRFGKQRISLPILVANKPFLNTKLVFWSAVIPFAGLSVWEFLSQRSGQKRRSRRGLRKDDIQEYIARRRAEADELTVILATGVEPRQRAERQKGGLVILSAKYGVKDAPPDEIADVTIAVAALVDHDGRLMIPKGLRKSRLLGFWDPAPMSTKILRIRYLHQGKEQTIEISGRDELGLP